MRISINGVGYDENDVPRALAMDALEAINFTVLSTTVRDMARAAEVVAAHQRCGGTKWRNHHPVMLLYASAISRITSESLGHTGNAGYEAAKKLCRLVAGEDWRGAQEQPGPISDSEVQKRMRETFLDPIELKRVQALYHALRQQGHSPNYAWTSALETATEKYRKTDDPEE